MFLQHVADAMNRVRSVFERRPQAALGENTVATACWTAGLRMEVRDESGRVVHTDMPEELGGTNEAVNPGWLFRAGLASCASTSILMAAIAEGVELERLEVATVSLSDARGMLGIPGERGEAIQPGPLEMTLQVTISSPQADEATLRGIVAKAISCSPVPAVASMAMPLAVEVNVAPGVKGK